MQGSEGMAVKLAQDMCSLLQQMMSLLTLDQAGGDVSNEEKTQSEKRHALKQKQLKRGATVFNKEFEGMSQARAKGKV